MNKQEKYCIHNFCESCAHIMEEKGEVCADCDYQCFSLAGECGNKTVSKCLVCGQELIDPQSKADFAQDLQLLDSALKNKNVKVICFTAPSVRVALGDEFGFPKGSNVQGKMVSALKKLGFSEVFDMNVAADFTIMEEAEELKNRLLLGKNLPMFTSCCPGWVNYCTKVCRNFIPNLSTCKSPQQMFGALINNYYAEKKGYKSTDMFVVSIVPCVAKKLELKQKGINTNVGYDVDVAITTKELARLLKEEGIDLLALPDSEFDDFFGVSSGAGAIFGNTGGVTEAVLRTFGDGVSEKELKKLDYDMVRGFDGIRRAEVKFGKKKLKLAVVTGLKNVNMILEELRHNPKEYDFIEVMACEGGCIGGPGQPSCNSVCKQDYIKKRAKGLYRAELKKEHRKAHKNPVVIKVYKEYLGEVGSKKAEKLLHREYK